MPRGLIVAVGLLALACGTGDGGGESAAGSVERLGLAPYTNLGFPDLETEGFEERCTDRTGRKIYVLRGRRAKLYEKTHQVIVSNVEVTYFGKSGERQSDVQADSARVDTTTKDITAWGNVILSSTNGTLLETDLLYWNNTDGKIHTDRPVRITTREGTVLEGVGMDGDRYLHEVKIYEATGMVRSFDGFR